jgi:hypothetical protein
MPYSDIILGKSMTFGLYSQKQTHPRPPGMDAADNPIIIIIIIIIIILRIN